MSTHRSSHFHFSHSFPHPVGRKWRFFGAELPIGVNPQHRNCVVWNNISGQDPVLSISGKLRIIALTCSGTFRPVQPKAYAAMDQCVYARRAKSTSPSPFTQYKSSVSALSSIASECHSDLSSPIYALAFSNTATVSTSIK